MQFSHRERPLDFGAACETRSRYSLTGYHVSVSDVGSLYCSFKELTMLFYGMN